MYCLAFNNFPFNGVNEKEVKFNIKESKNNSQKFSKRNIKEKARLKNCIQDKWTDSFLELLKNMLAYDKSYRFDLAKCLNHV